MPTTPDSAATSSSAPGTVPTLSRRSLLSGALGAGGVLLFTACTNDATVSSGGNTSARAAAGTANEVNLVARFDQELYAVTGREQRLVVSFLNKQGEPPKGLADTIEFTTTRDGKPVGPAVRVMSHQDGVPVPYFPVPFTADQPGTYTLAAKVGAETSSTVFKVVAPDKNRLLGIGDKMRVADTPTTADARGVKPICTRVGKDGPNPCPLHDLNLRDAIAAAKPIALLVSSPAFCAIGVCGPVLELVLEMKDRYPVVQFIHAEVYVDPKSDSRDTAPIIETLGLTYEPALYLVGADGTVVHRLDYVFDRSEIKRGLDRLG